MQKQEVTVVGVNVELLDMQLVAHFSKPSRRDILLNRVGLPAQK